MRFFALLLLSCLTCFGQPGPIALRSIDAWAAGGFPNDPSTISGLAYRWVSADLPVGGTVSNWVDEIQGLPMTNGATAKQPTNAALGVAFNNNWFLTNANVTGGSIALSSFVVIERTINDNTRSIMGNKVNHHVFMFDMGLVASAAWEYLNPGAILCSGASSKLPTNTFMTLIHDDRGIVTGTTHFYTNGVQSVAIPSGNMESPTINTVGNDGQGNLLIGYIKEICLYTNTLTAVNASNLNWYATNRYQYVP